MGADASRWKKGDEVFGLAYGGAYAQFISVSGLMVLPKPRYLSHEECAGIPEVRVFLRPLVISLARS